MASPDDAGALGQTPPPVVEEPRRLGLVAAVAAVVLVFDQASKHWALNALQDGPIDLIGSLRFYLTYNTGAAFSLASGRGIGPIVTVLAVVVIAGLAFGYTSRHPLGATSVGLIAGGAVGNLIDRAFRGDDGFLQGAVVDFIDLQWWPVFNIADAAIVVGAVLLVVVSFRIPAS